MLDKKTVHANISLGLALALCAAALYVVHRHTQDSFAAALFAATIVIGLIVVNV